MVKSFYWVAGISILALCVLYGTNGIAVPVPTKKTPSLKAGNAVVRPSLFAAKSCHDYTAGGCLKAMSEGLIDMKRFCCDCFGYKVPNFTAGGCTKAGSRNDSPDERKNKSDLCLLCIQG